MSTGPRTADGKRRSVLSSLPAKQARFERLRAMKAAGLIEKLPGRPPGLKRVKEEAAAVLAKVEKDGLPAVAGASSIGQELEQLTGESIKVMREIVRRKRPYKGDAHKLKVLQKETAASALNAQLRADENVLRARQQGGALAPVLAALLQAAGEPLPVASDVEKAAIVGFTDEEKGAG